MVRGFLGLGVAWLVVVLVGGQRERAFRGPGFAGVTLATVVVQHVGAVVASANDYEDFLLLIPSAPFRGPRRSSLRRHLLTSPQLKYFRGQYRFILDAEPAEALADARKENRTHGDIWVSDSPPGLFLAHRLRHTIRLAVESGIPFKFLVISDDDVFWCIRHLARFWKVLGQPWRLAGWPHCEAGFWLDQHALIMGRGIAEDIVARYDQLMCCPYGDIALRHWQLTSPHVYDYLPSHTAFYHEWVHRTPVNTSMPDVCNDYVAIHYVHTDEYMAELAQNAAESAKRPFDMTRARARWTNDCPAPVQDISVSQYEQILKSRSHLHQLFPCNANERWGLTDAAYTGGL
ncbi:uncharacterized protein MONBRDRAFT_38643 [Monosiga brevicollis MX1]|uniref:Hexosyltransferase n=1 Tax=Monosiga brevicollis TaxID=81824 RepID=A9V9J7_MONBE|nr:uncharacterized protein MONBRDRAFT_38643 [Monosiga brevicollis MX1]EDQ85807.1 predicted protein [Monosiga brevicollis MX1]|eukprot:XP_001749286.1 hypothetical protein [Monosiga brevicollis MX1]